LSENFDPLGAIARADAALLRYRVFASEGARDRAAIAGLCAELEAASRDLALQAEFFAKMTPGWWSFAFKFGVGLGGLAAMPLTLGWSLVLTAASTGLALNDAREFADNNAQLDRLRHRMQRIHAALQDLIGDA
jgi:hypothetical protein